MSSEWLFIHGWGYDASAWESWKNLIPVTDFIHHYDRGYFGAPNDPSFATDRRRILVTHSLGCVFFDPDTMGMPDIWVVISGFDRFCDSDIEKRTTRRMRDRLRMGIVPVLQAFYENSGDKERGIPQNHDLDKLSDDLILLEENESASSVMRRCGKMVILHARHDRIVAIDKAQRLGFPLTIHSGDSHALPFTEPDWCWNSLKNMLG
jgi:hypothetical protein